MKTYLIAGLIIMGSFGLLSGLAAKPPPAKIVLDKCKKKKSGVAFDHAKHSKKLKIECKTCHHKGKSKPCTSCHAGKAKEKKPGCAEMSMKKNPYHLTCAGCHKKLKKGPKTCKQCHK